MASDDRDKKDGARSKKPILEKGMFGRRIRITHEPGIKHNSPYLPDGDLSFNILGTRGCGESTLMCELIPQIANLGQIIICSRISYQVSKVYPAIEEYCNQQDPPIKFEVFTDPATAQEGIERMIEEREEGKDGLIIFDDFSDASSSRSDPYNKCMNVCAQLLRNHRYHIMCITQSATGLPTLTRNNANIRIIFQMNDHNSVESIRRDVVQSGIVPDKEAFDELYRQIRRQPHSYLMLVQKGGQTGNRLFIYINGEMSVPQEVKISAPPGEEDLIEIIKSDAFLRRQIEMFNANDEKTRFGRAQRRLILNHLREYAETIAKNATLILKTLLKPLDPFMRWTSDPI